MQVFFFFFFFWGGDIKLINVGEHLKNLYLQICKNKLPISVSLTDKALAVYCKMENLHKIYLIILFFSSGQRIMDQMVRVIFVFSFKMCMKQ